MRYGLIYPERKSAMLVDIASMDAALRRVGLLKGATDHGTVVEGLAVVVGEFGLFVPPEQQSYFAIAGYDHLLAGPAVLYGYNVEGHDVELVQLPRIEWLPDRPAVERAIAAGLVKRPHLGMGDDVIWRWPGPRPSEAERDRLAMKILNSPATVVDGDTYIFTTPAKDPPK